MSQVDQTSESESEFLPAESQADVVTDHNHKLYIETVGCQMNMLDSELVVADLRKRGYELTRDVKEAETILFNTCSVREHAEHKIYSSLGRLRYGARKNPKKVIGVMGCMAQKDQNLIFQKAPQVDFVVGTGQLAQVASLIDKARVNHSQNVRSRELAVGLGRKDGKLAEITNSFQSYDPLRDPEMRPSPYQAL
ncbi:MAG TPA: tRNA (N6-isopentenyl adenosine(37)-C2)-methylthiotransferase MiaB, partial [Planctomycetaceae bacterium]|nr:tRNA (N6-isopentenyl adenosine(37)-C2)-methylthiotransferase MiaB [Planctomycetaceae bacterium]